VSTTRSRALQARRPDALGASGYLWDGAPVGGRPRTAEISS